MSLKIVALNFFKLHEAKIGSTSTILPWPVVKKPLVKFKGGTAERKQRRKKWL
jgi:hypothetical protein